MTWKDKLIFVSAQPDVPYFHWQCEVYLNNFIELGIPKENIHVLFAMVNKTTDLSDGAKYKIEYLIDKYTGMGYTYINSYDDADGFLDTPRLGFMVK